ncbi:MAG: hypothetical protein ACPGSC_01590 [Granulosicoccaceae bacterium]
MKRISNYLLLGLLTVPICTQANWTFDWNGYGTIGVTQFKNYDAINADSRLPYGDFYSSTSEKPDTKFSLQGSAHFSENISASMQLISHAKYDYEPEVEWAYLRLQPTENLTLRAGRIRRHAYLQSDNYDIGYSYVWVRPPTTAYLSIGPIYRALEAVDLYYQGSNSQFDYSAQLYVGQADDSAEMFGVKSDYEEHRASGLTLAFEAEGTELQLSHHRSNFDLEYPEADEVRTALLALGFADIADNYDFTDRDARVYGLGFSKKFNTWDLAAEFVHSDFDEAQIPTFDGWYFTATKHIDNLSLYAGYGFQSTEVSRKLENDIRAEAESALATGTLQGLFTSSALQAIEEAIRTEINRQLIERSSVQVGLRYDFKEFAAFKLEYENLKDRLNNKSGSLYSVSLDFVF